MNKNQKPEILAPAGSFESLQAAVRCGADAVYLGVTEFSARRNAENFELQQLPQTVAFCHIRGVKVYLAMNILLRNEELSSALSVAKTAARAGIDGIIVQDLGFTKMLHQVLPELPLHASTQMSVLSPGALPLLKRMGICRVVAGREMTATEISKLCESARALEMTVEIFVHGALCMSVSGQCLLSAILGGRSGNRGLCAGPCRLPFGVPNGTGFDLSLKDLSLFSHVQELAEMGVASLKIEGRMKRPEYVAAATAACRAAIDQTTVPQDLQNCLQNVFSRSGFTDGYFMGERGRNMFGIRTKEDVVAANAALPLLHARYRSERQSVPVSARLELRKDVPAKLALTDGKHSVTAEGEIPQPAKQKPLEKETVLSNLQKLGSTPYFLQNVDITLGENLFLSSGQLNALRRDAVDLLNASRAVVPEVPVKKWLPQEVKSTHAPMKKLVVRLQSVEQIPEDLSGVHAVLIPLEWDPAAFSRTDVLRVVDLPRGIENETKIVEKLQQFHLQGYTWAFCGNLSAVTLAKKCGFRIFAAPGLNAYNTQSIASLQSMGAEAVTFCIETKLSDAVNMPSSLPKGIFAYGRIPLMLTRNCPARNGHDCAHCDHQTVLTDRKKINFPVTCRMGFAEILNSKVLYLADRLRETEGLDFLLLWFTLESKEKVGHVLQDYRVGGSMPEDATRGLTTRTTL